MCGIFGAASLKEYKKLYTQNKKRGTFAYGAVFVDDHDGNDLLTQIPGVMKRETAKDVYKFYLGHTQAPTSVEREFSEETGHPFVHGNWVVAHNGVLTNFDELKETYFIEYNHNVDSSIFPALIDKVEYDNPNELHSEIIATALSLIKGTFAVWVYNCDTREIYIARQGSTLFFDKFDNKFSSINCQRSFEEAEEGVVYQITHEGITKVAEFQQDTPFFIL